MNPSELDIVLLLEAVNYKSVKLKGQQTDNFNVLDRKLSRRLSKRASQVNATRSGVLKTDGFNLSKQTPGLTESQFLLINCDFKDSVSFCFVFAKND